MDLSRGFLPEWVWWKSGECVVKVLSIGHFPTTALVQLPNDKVIEVDMYDLDTQRGD